ncbi:hypothetical protein Tco_0439058, partial [Tanacetum coccineum]
EMEKGWGSKRGIRLEGVLIDDTSSGLKVDVLGSPAISFDSVTVGEDTGPISLQSTTLLPLLRIENGRGVQRRPNKTKKLRRKKPKNVRPKRSA